MKKTEAGAETKKKPKRIPEKSVRVSMQIIVAIFLFVTVINIFSPAPIAFVIRSAFNSPNLSIPRNYSAIEQGVTETRELKYTSIFDDNVADIFVPNDATEPLPLIIWVHGGGFVGGNKEDVGIYARTLAYQGYVVLAVNYERAPESTYPSPVKQLGEVYLWLGELSKTFPIDASRIILAGDSAGAHIVAQFALIQTNSEYAAEIGIPPLMPPETLKGLLLFCGPYDVAKISESGNILSNFFIQRAAWAYFGVTNWQDVYGDEASIKNHVTQDFPPSFISDANTFSFEPQGRDLGEALRRQGVTVDEYYIPITTERTDHEYQFIMDTPAGEESFERMLAFVKEHI